MTERSNSGVVKKAPQIFGEAFNPSISQPKQGGGGPHTSTSTQSRNEKSSQLQNGVNTYTQPLVMIPERTEQQYTGSNRILMMGKTSQQIIQQNQVQGRNQSGIGNVSQTQQQQNSNIQNAAGKKSRRLRKNFDLLSQALKQQTNQQSGYTEKMRPGGISDNSRNAYIGGQNYGSQPIVSGNMIDHGMNSNLLGLNNRQTNSSANDQQQILAYGSGGQAVLATFKDNRKTGGANSHAPSGYYDMLVTQTNNTLSSLKQHYHSQRAGSTAASQKQQNLGGIPSLPNHGNSLYSHISLKESSPPKKINSSTTRNVNLPPSVAMGQLVYTQLPHHNLSSHQPSNNSHNLPAAGLDLKTSHFLKQNPVAMIASGGGASKHQGAIGTSNSRKSNENIMHHHIASHQDASSHQPILNINTASDINIYNNSFIVNTGTAVAPPGQGPPKKQGGVQSQNQSRSSSLKRNVSGGGSSSNQQLRQVAQGRNLGNPGNALKNQYPGSNFSYINSATGQGLLPQDITSGGLNLTNIIAMNNDYQITKATNHHQSQRVHNQSSSSVKRLSSTTGGVPPYSKKHNQITEAYTAQNFFLGGPLGTNALNQNPGTMLTTQQRNNNNTSKKMIKLNGGKQQKQSVQQYHKKQNSSSQQNYQAISNLNYQLLTNQQQQSYTQSFDMQPFNSSTELSSSQMSQVGILKKNGGGGGLGYNKLHFASNHNVQRVKNSRSVNRILQRDSSIGGSGYYQHSDSLMNDDSKDLGYMLGGQRSHSPDISQVISASKTQKAKNQSLVLLKQGKKKVIEKDYNQAIEYFTQSLTYDQENTDAKFFRAISQLDSGLIQEAISELKNITLMNGSHSPVCHIVLSIAFNRIGEQQQALLILNDCISLYPQYPDAYQARGQALLIQEKYSEALQDFQRFSGLMPANGLGFLGVGDSHKALKQWQQAITAYSKAIQLLSLDEPMKTQAAIGNTHVMQATLKRGLAYYHMQLYEQSMKDFQAAIKLDLTSIKAHFYIGKILSKQFLGEIVVQYQRHTSSRQDDPPKTLSSKQLQKIQNEAILHFEQVVKYHQTSGEVYAGNALFEIAKLRLQDKDFYEAYFNLKRAVDSNFTSKRLQLYKDFTEGVLYLIKRKIKKGVQILSDLLEVLVNNKKNKKDQKQLDYLKHQSYLYRAYGYVAIEKYEVALQDIKKAKKVGKLDAATVYNKLLGKGILRMDHEDYIMATKYFTKASTKFTANKDSYCLHIISMVRSYTYSHAGMCIDQDDKLERIMKARDFMNFAITQCNAKLPSKVPSLYFFRGLLHFQMHMFYQALQDFNVAIEEEEEPTASYYLARGRTYACLSILSEAMKDLSIAINLDESLQEAYIYRGKCAYLLGDNNLAFLDFQRLILTDPKNPMVHVYAGNLLMTTGAYNDAIKAFLNADTVQKTAVAAFQRARCYCALTDLENAKMQFKIALTICKTEKLIQIDSQILSALMKVITVTSQNQAQAKKDTSQKQVQEAIQSVNEIIEFFLENKIKLLKKKDSSMNIQVIPNVKRIKVEKVAVAKDLYRQQQQLEANQEGGGQSASKVPDLTLCTDDMLDQATIDLDALKHIPLHSYYYENVFCLEDLYLFRAVFYFYAGDYQSAIDGYLQCQNMKLNEGNERKSMYGYDDELTPGDNAESMKAYSRSSTPMLSMNSSKTDLSDVGLCSLNVHETNYNILLCHLMMGQHTKSLEKLNELIQQAPGKYQRHFFLLRGLLYQKTDQKDKAAKDLAKYEKQEPKLNQSFFKDKKDITFEPFPIKNRLCSRFENVTIPRLGENQPKILLRPSFSMPFIKPPNMIPNIDEDSIQSEFSLKQIDAPMPEAPWIRRWGGEERNNEGGIKFTDSILLDDEEGGDEDQDDDDNGMQLGKEETKQKDKKKNQEKSGSKLDLKEVQSKHKPPATLYQQKVPDESPYMQSIEVQPPTHGRLRTLGGGGIGEQIIKQHQSHGFNNSAHQGNSAMMVYQLVGEVVDVDQLSDKHKISLFDESRYEDGDTIGRGSIDLNQNRKQFLLRDSEGNGLEAGDSLYDEHLLNNASLDNDDSDSSSCSDNNNSSDNEQDDGNSKSEFIAVGRQQRGEGGVHQASSSLVQVDNSTVLLDSVLVPKRNKKAGYSNSNQGRKRQAAGSVNPMTSHDGGAGRVSGRQHQTKDESIFRSNQSTQR